MSTRKYISIFYPPLPEEVWFIIYKIEHQSLINLVNREIKKLAYEVELFNKRMCNLLPMGIHELVNLKKTTGVYIDTQPGKYQGTIIYNTIDFVGHDGWRVAGIDVI